MLCQVGVLEPNTAMTVKASVEERVGIDPVGSSPEAFTRYLRAESARFGPAIKAANIRAE